MTRLVSRAVGRRGARERNISWGVALVGMTGVILAGLIGAGSALISTNMTLGSQQVQAREGFVRANRLSAYAKFISDAQSTLQALDTCSGAARGGRISSTDVTEVNSDIAQSQEALNSSASALQVIGSVNAAGLALKVAADTRGAEDACDSGSSFAAKGPSVAMQRAVSTELRLASKDLQSFIFVARDDVQT